MTAPQAPAPRRMLATGVYRVGSRAVVLPEQLACSVQELVDSRIAGVLLLPTMATTARSAVAYSSQLELGLTAPLLEWLSETRPPTVVEVPLAFRRMLRCFRALALPIATPVLHLGSVVIPDPVHARATSRLLERLTADFALRLETWQRQEVLAYLASDDSDALAPNSRPLTRVSSIPPVSSRRTA